MLLVGKSLGAARSEDNDGTLGRTVKKVALAFLNMFLASFVSSVVFPGVGSDAK